MAVDDLVKLLAEELTLLVRGAGQDLAGLQRGYFRGRPTRKSESLCRTVRPYAGNEVTIQEQWFCQL